MPPPKAANEVLCEILDRPMEEDAALDAALAAKLAAHKRRRALERQLAAADEAMMEMEPGRES